MKSNGLSFNNRSSSLLLNSSNSSSRLFVSNRLFSTNVDNQDEEIVLDTKGKMIHNLLSDSLKPSSLKVIDMSGGCGSMYRIEIISKEFNNKNTLNQHRQVNSVLKEVIPTLHGLTLYTSGENK
ncbi:bolA family protein [Heterostelium album PN500]|uniref:BolA family protein n=1 Tax=Heterostelium pallidum (strain ATCC 26659 / Pp 5 / PN500) TaxID=670386 RepID=D3BFD9_HETP5|nr:bolA family protein [Heterostelium album PN500]EFA79853.1 bolA family protein [Heterostelium album PN500]|eukprot:XP_020431974.1 bolA family protein [Heterostelium album PN500]